MRPTTSRAFAFALAAAALSQGLPLAAQAFEGTFSTTGGDGVVWRLTVAEDPSGDMRGTLAVGATTYRLDGTVSRDYAEGTLTASGEILRFEAERSSDEVVLTLFGTDRARRAVYDDATEVTLYPEDTPLGAYGPSVSGGNPLARDPLGREPYRRDLPGYYGARDPYVGSFTDGYVTLRLDGYADRYEGEIVVGGRPYGVSAFIRAGGLQATLHAPDGDFPMAIRVIDGGLYVQSGGREYRLYDDRAQRGGFTRPWGADPGFGGYDRNDPEALAWTRQLTGTRVTRVVLPDMSGGRWDGRGDVELCTGGRFTLRGSVAEDDAAGRPRRGTAPLPELSGIWYVVGDGVASVLVLEPAAGGVIELQLSRGAGSTFVNGGRVLITPSRACR